jgi:UDP-2-acetamido-3-amino-2,3-dideoxy-glucuronate N-acetyltransferase
MNSNFYVHPTAVIDQPCEIGTGSKIWHFVHVGGNAAIGCQCILGQNVMIAPGVRVGNNVKIQNNVAVYSGVEIEDDVFLGPSCVLTNVSNPRSQVVRRGLYERTLIRRGATVGANATVVCGVTLGRYCLIAAGAVVTHDVPDYAMIVGVPGRQRGWVSRHGHPLRRAAGGIFTCPESGLHYEEPTAGRLRCIDLDEEAPLPPELAAGRHSYRSFRSG